MIYFVVNQGERFGMEQYLAKRGRALRDRISVVTYRELGAGRRLPLGTYIFAALDKLSPAHAGLVERIWESRSQAGGALRLLNHPRRALLRYDLLRELHRLGRNRFDVARVSEISRVRSFPVFLREIGRHTGSLSALLHSRRELNRALIGRVLRGYDPSDLMVVEFCDTSDAGGFYRKYSAMMMGGEVIPRCLEIASEWVVKHDVSVVSEEAAAEELRYVAENPHKEWLLETFRLARIDYGRIDYGVLGEEPQVWEINTNPTIGPGPKPKPVTPERQRRRELVAEARSIFYSRFRAAFEAIDPGDPRGHVLDVRFSESELVALAKDHPGSRLLGGYQRVVPRLRASRILRFLRPLIEPVILWASPPLVRFLERLTARRSA